MKLYKLNYNNFKITKIEIIERKNDFVWFINKNGNKQYNSIADDNHMFHDTEDKAIEHLKRIILQEIKQLKTAYKEFENTDNEEHKNYLLKNIKKFERKLNKI
jgi:hypothetical protein